MKILILLTTLLSLISCSSTKIEGMKLTNKSPRGISILNIKKEERSIAYQTAEKHCAKYYKVPRVTRKVEQAAEDEFQVSMRTMDFRCEKPKN